MAQPTKNPLARLPDLGQSIWFDYIRRDMVQDGTLARLIATDELRGMTSNPTIFAQAIAGSTLYDGDIRAAAATATNEQIFETLAIADIRAACDVFRPVYDKTKGLDGYVSLEVSPKLARDTAGTTKDAARLWKAVDRPNLMIKIPGTQEGLPAIEASLAAGINVNVTLLFSVERYREVMDAWLRALEARAAKGLAVDRIASVASFFVSRVDTNVDKAIDAALKTAAAPLASRLTAAKSTLAIANARLAYQAYLDAIARHPRFAALKAKGAMPQRALWASTSTKSKTLPDVLYVEALIGKDTVNTVPPATYDAYRDHGDPADRVTDDLAAAKAAFQLLKDAGIDFAAITRELEIDGVKKFAESFDELLASIQTKRAAIASR
ncbi:MAG: transaldolase [Planctomycetes bacterium]|nr:transaldolase [Planctomycetota bacterium]